MTGVKLTPGEPAALGVTTAKVATALAPTTTATRLMNVLFMRELQSKGGTWTTCSTSVSPVPTAESLPAPAFVLLVGTWVTPVRP
jgi:hypothetical protein